MADKFNSVLLPFMAPTTESLRAAAANIIRDIQREHEETDMATAARLKVSIGTIRNVRNEMSDPSSLLIAKIAYEYGDEAIEPYRALYAKPCLSAEMPITELAEAMAALSRAKSPKARMDALPAMKVAVEALEGFIAMTERERLRIVA